MSFNSTESAPFVARGLFTCIHFPFIPKLYSFSAAIACSLKESITFSLSQNKCFCKSYYWHWNPLQQNRYAWPVTVTHIHLIFLSLLESYSVRFQWHFRIYICVQLILCIRKISFQLSLFYLICLQYSCYSCASGNIFPYIHK